MSKDIQDRIQRGLKMYCEKCKKPIMASGGGTYCRVHQMELCRVARPHCYSCGEWL